ncbi:hypothetical protein [Streptomyces violascens]|uniref:hypothetical protein n=1 Tax=Streptomyces violascens TaxID=67381 RepID=UPI0036D19186
MINRFFRAPRRRLITVAILAAVVVAFGWYAAQPVYPACTVFAGAYVPINASAADRDAASR